MKREEASLYLIPVGLGDHPLDEVLPSGNTIIIQSIRYFIVENIRTARRFLKRVDSSIDIDALTFYTLDKYTKLEELTGFLEPIQRGFSVGIISEAGCPAIADPGADVVAIAQEKGYRIVPLVGPSSILLGLMGSGFNGQSFAFNGYLPIEDGARTKALKLYEGRIYGESQTQLFIETPYRNHKLIEEMIKTLRPTTKLCVAVDLTLESEMIKTMPLLEWKKFKGDLHKRPALFLLYK